MVLVMVIILILILIITGVVMFDMAKSDETFQQSGKGRTEMWCITEPLPEILGVALFLQKLVKPAL